MKNLTFIVGLLVWVGMGCSSAPPPKPKAPPPKVVEINADANREFFQDASFSYEFIRTLGASVYQGADIRECLDAAKLIKKGDFETWYSAWTAMAERVRATTVKSMNRDHPVSAFQSLLRVSTYYRVAEHYLHGNPLDPRNLSTWKLSRDFFVKAIHFSTVSITPVQIPYEQIKLPGYFYAVDKKKKPKPLLILQSGFDGAQEELYGIAIEGVKRGYNVLTFDGPGQGLLLREKNIPLRVDWEFVLRPVLDFALKLKTTDPDRIAVYGMGLGGYFAARGAAYDHRIKALVVNSGTFDAMEGLIQSSPSMGQALSVMKTDSKKTNELVRALMTKRTQNRWFFEHGMYAFQSKSPSEFLAKYKELKMKDSIEMIIAPTLVLESEIEAEGFVGQAQAFVDHLKNKKTYVKIKATEGGDAPVQNGSFLSSEQRVFDWLDEVLGV